MTIKEFISNYLIANNKEKFMAEHIVRKYVPYAEKIARCQAIINNTMYTEVEGMKRFTLNTPLQYQQFVVSLIQMYTDIDLVDGESYLIIFDRFEEEGITEVFVSCLGTEFAKFQTIFKMMVDDTIASETDLVTWLQRKVDAIGVLSEGLLENPEIKEMLGKMIEE